MNCIKIQSKYYREQEDVLYVTFAGPVRSSQDSTLIYAAKGLKQPSDVLIALLFSQHPHKQLPVLWETMDLWHKEKKRIQIQSFFLLNKWHF